MPRIRNAARAVIIHDDAILLQICHIDGEELHILPGGTQEFGEPLDATVRREVLEETGLTVRVEGLLWVCELVELHAASDESEDVHVVGCIFRCTPEPDVPVVPATVPDVAQIDVRWVMLSELPTLTLVPRAVQPLLIAWHDHGEPLIPTYLGSRA